LIGVWPLLAAAVATPAVPKDADLAAVIECRADLSVALDMMTDATNDPDYGPKRGWRRDPEGPLYRPTYTLARPITVFGHQTVTITFESETVFAVLPGVKAAALGEQLGIKAEMEDGDTFMGGRFVRHIEPEGPSAANEQPYDIALQVSNFSLDANDGQTRAGCSYHAAGPYPPKGN
jgi:hypothetical protein